MTLVALMLLQAGASLPPIAFDLAKLKPGDACAAGTGGEIVVCARRRAPDYRVTGDTDAPDGMKRAEGRLFGQVHGSLHGEQNMVGGFPSNRMMVTLTLPF